MTINESADGVGGTIFACGESYDELMNALLDRYDNIYCADQAALGYIRHQQPELEAYMNELKEKSHYTREDVENCNINPNDIRLYCSDLYTGKKGFRQFLEVLEEYNYDGRISQEIDEVSKSYDSLGSMSFTLEQISEKVWCY